MTNTLSHTHQLYHQHTSTHHTTVILNSIVHNATNNQQFIGWQHYYKGHSRKMRSILQEQYYSRRAYTNTMKDTILRRQTRLLQTAIRQRITILGTRNQSLYGEAPIDMLRSNSCHHKIGTVILSTHMQQTTVTHHPTPTMA